MEMAGTFLTRSNRRKLLPSELVYGSVEMERYPPEQNIRISLGACVLLKRTSMSEPNVETEPRTKPVHLQTFFIENNGVHCGDLGESLPTNILLQKSAWIQPPVPSVFEDTPVYQPASQPRTSPGKGCPGLRVHRAYRERARRVAVR